MLKFYTGLMGAASLPLRHLLARRLARGKEEAGRLGERMGRPGAARPPGKLIWLHAASVGEAQSILSLTAALLERTRAFVLITTGTVNSARLLAQRLSAPEMAGRALHQYYPLDRPAWVGQFLDHWRPDLMIWTESELWPSMLLAARARHVPAILVNARLSDRSYRRWKRARGPIRQLLQSFALVLAQTDDDTARFAALGAPRAETAGNLKYSAAPLPVAPADLQALRAATQGRPLWFYASTHAGEEELAGRLHSALRRRFPGLLTVIAPRHPHRAAAIAARYAGTGLIAKCRTGEKLLPETPDDIYIADTIGELGLFYRLAPVACVGRSFSDDGGGGHNPLEGAQLGCAVLHGPAIQNLAAIYAEMDAAGAAIPLPDAAAFEAQLARLLADPAACAAQQRKGTDFLAAKAAVLDKMLAALAPWLARAGIVAARAA